MNLDRIPTVETSTKQEASNTEELGEEKMSTLTEKKFRLPRHYRLYLGGIACGKKSSRLEATGSVGGVTCKRCLIWLAKRGLK